ncbi:PEP-CTERM sorting domain-containing protein [Tundrisphaera lichenicola]|uniref:PEP-CTERM sorting domain-containing protein n=1 Tax=Tundrisphaera lichenicola TaxID=2029860 RepID=UPI003EB71288
MFEYNAFRNVNYLSHRLDTEGASSTQFAPVQSNYFQGGERNYNMRRAKLMSIVRTSAVRLAIVTAIGAGWSSAARADFTFDADGAGGQASAQTITGLNYGAGNALSVGAIQNGGLQVGSTFQLLFQTHLSQVVNGVSSSTPTGLDSDYQITLVASFTERVTSITTIAGVGTIATFELVPTATDSIKIFFNSSKVYNNADGTGFAVGTEIASLDPSFVGSSYTDRTALPASQGGGIKKFNTTGSGNGLSATTNSGTGSTTIGAAVLSYDSNFFQPPSGNPQLLTSLVDLGVDPIFNVVSASKLFVDISNGSTHAANIGSNNGTSGPDFQLEVAGFTQSFTAVPEPASVAMTLLGLGSFGFGSFVARRRRTGTSA